jgi:L-rhamnose mutarotase
MHRIVPSGRNPLWIIAVFLMVFICSCSHENARLQISFEGKTYSYEKIQHTIKDIEKEPINTSWIETENCIIQYSNEYEDYLGNMISISEQGYKRVSKDLLYDSKDFIPQIWFLNDAEFRRLSRAISGAIATGDDGGVAIINVDKHKFGDNAIAVVAHEITHLIFNRISGTSYKIMLSKHPQYAQSFHSFSEALAQIEDPFGAPIEERLLQSFPNLDFITLEIIDAKKNTEKSYIASTVELCALIKFIRVKWGRGTLVDIISSMEKNGLAQAIEKCTNMPINEFQIKWFSYMADMIEKHKEQNSLIPGGN